MPIENVPVENMPCVGYKTFDSERQKFSPYGFSCEGWTAQAMPWPDQHNEIELNFLSKGSLTYLLGSKKVTLEVGKLSVFWAAVPHQIVDFSPGTTYFVATIPLEHFFRWPLPAHFVQSLMLGSLFSENSCEWREFDELMFARWQGDEDKMRAALMLEIQARLTRLAIRQTNYDSCPDNTKGARSGSELVNCNSWNKIAQMALFIAQSYTKKLTVDSIADHVGLHPKYAMKLFQDAIGTTMLNYLTQYRVSHAQRLLATTNERITEIAYLSGFQSISRFNSIFLSASNCSPRDYRRTSLSATV